MMSQDESIDYDDFQGSTFPDLSVLYPDEFYFLHACAKLIVFEANEPVIVEGQSGEYLYLVKSGQLRVNKRHGGNVYEVGSINQGDIFGEASVLYQGAAGAEVRAIERSELYGIPSAKVRELFESNERFQRAATQMAERRSAASSLAVNPIFSTLPLAVREVALYNAKFISIKEGDVLIREGDDDARFMFIVLAGEAQVSMRHPTNPGKLIIFANLVSGDEAGEIAVVTERPHGATVTATAPVRLLVISNDSIIAWSERYSDFAYALFGQVHRKLKTNRQVLRTIIDDRDARSLTTNSIPSLEAFKEKHNL
ncbi:MAG: cyclic nucleotide-binding domain-containing protein [Ghiorsea sp.]